MTYEVELALDTRQAVVVKFVRGYDTDGHEFMAARNLAPRLIHYSKLSDGYGDLGMVVMGKVVGKTLVHAYPDGPLLAHRRCVGRWKC